MFEFLWALEIYSLINPKLYPPVFSNPLRGLSVICSFQNSFRILSESPNPLDFKIYPKLYISSIFCILLLTKLAGIDMYASGLQTL